MGLRSTGGGFFTAAPAVAAPRATAPKLKLYVVHGSHPCAAVERALSLKALPYRVVEWPQPLQAPIQQILFGARTVPALRVDGREKVSGSRAIMHRLEQLVPEPPLYPIERIDDVEEAERWGETVLQQVARRLAWSGLTRCPEAMVSYAQGARRPLPDSVVKRVAPIVIRLEYRLNHVTEEAVRSDLAALGSDLDKIDSWVEAGTIGDPEHPNAADLQIGSSIALLRTMADVRPLLHARPCARLADVVGPLAGELPEGALRPAP
jgi:glutathione S-transferase